MTNLRSLSLFAFLFAASLGCSTLPDEEPETSSDVASSEEELKTWGNCWLDGGTGTFCCLYQPNTKEGPCYACSTGNNDCGW